MSDASVGLSKDELQTLLDAHSEAAWSKACDAIKGARGGQYPFDWFAKILATGFMNAKQKEWGETDVRAEMKNLKCVASIEIKLYEEGRVSTEVECFGIDNQTMVLLGMLAYAKRVVEMDAGMDDGIKKNMLSRRGTE
jgi:hypothetical protein